MLPQFYGSVVPKHSYSADVAIVVLDYSSSRMLAYFMSPDLASGRSVADKAKAPSVGRVWQRILNSGPSRQLNCGRLGSSRRKLGPGRPLTRTHLLTKEVWEDCAYGITFCAARQVC